MLLPLAFIMFPCLIPMTSLPFSLSTQYLDKIAEVYFGVQAPKGLLDGIMDIMGGQS